MDTVVNNPPLSVEPGSASSPQRYRLLALVQSENKPIHAQRGPSASRYQLQRGDADWFFENISCQSACPAHTDVARYIAHLADGNYDAAHDINLEDNLFPGILGRICARPCETACRRGKLDDPISICSLKRGAADFADWQLPAAAPRLWPEQVAVVGAGPTGLAAANGLAKAGYRVVVFEAQSVAGGMLRWGIPEFRLPRDLCQREIDDYFVALGVEIRLNTRVGQDVTLAQLQNEFEAVYLAAGTQEPQMLDLPAQHEAGVISGLTYMELVNLAPDQARQQTGKRVAVIGGGFTAMDCARSALRLGADEVYVLYRRSSQELVVGEYEVEEAQNEGAEFKYMVAPLGVKGKGGKALGLVMVHNEMGEPGEDGRRRPRQITGSNFEQTADTIITATGQNPALDWLGPSFAGLHYREMADHTTFATPLPGLFAGGDFLMGSRNVISAVADGRKAAYTIGAWLRSQAVGQAQWPPFGVKEQTLKTEFKPVLLGRDMRFNRYRQKVVPLGVQQSGTMSNSHNPAETALRLPTHEIADWTHTTMIRRTRERDIYQEIERRPMRVIPLIERKHLASEVETGFTPTDVKAEAQRCLQCQLNIFIDAPVCILCNTCVDVCPTKVIKMVDLAQVTSIDGESQPIDLQQARQWENSAAMIIDEDLCIRCGECVKWCPTGCLSMQHFQPVVEAPMETLPSARPFSHSINLLELAGLD